MKRREYRELLFNLPTSLYKKRQNYGRIEMKFVYLQKKIGIVIIRGLSWDHKAIEKSDIMAADKEGTFLEYVTTMCGGFQIWFLPKVTYSHEL